MFAGYNSLNEPQCTSVQLDKQSKNKQTPRRTKDYMLGWQAPDWNTDSCAVGNLDSDLDCKPIENQFKKNKKSINGPFSQ